MSIRKNRTGFRRRLTIESLEERMVLSSPDLAPSLGPPPSPSPSVIWVNTESALQSAINNLQSGQTVVIQKGTYDLSNTLYIGKNHPVTNVTIRGETDNFNDVVLLGKGMDNASYGNVPMGISVYNAQNVTIADLSIGQVYYDPIELKGDVGASQIQINHTRLFDAGEQFIKADPNSSGGGVDNSSVKYSLIEYTAGPPTTDHGGGVGYTNGIDVHAGQNWDIADNLIRNLHTPDSSANLWNPAILIWNHSSNVTVERNTIINCDRAIAMGLVNQSSGYDNQNGIVRNNFVSMSPGLFSSWRQAGADAQILAWDSPGTKIDHNTVLTNGNAPNSIQTRWTTTGAQVLNNLSDVPYRARDGATATVSGNYWGATTGMFVNAAAADLHLVSNTATQANVIDKVAPLADVPDDWDGTSRPVGSNADIGAGEYGAAATTAPAVTGTSPSAAATGVAAGATASATFNESVQASSVGFTLKDGSGQAVVGPVGYNDATHTATLTPSAPLSPSTTYTATVSGAKDASGNVMASPFSWSFTTAAAPTVTGESPAPGATGVSAASAVSATFSLSMQGPSIAFTLNDAAGNQIPASLSYNDSTRTATLTPSAPLSASTTYTATVSAGTSSAGFALGSPMTWSFTTDAPSTGGTWTQTTAADFNAGTQSGTTVTNSAGGEVQLAPSFSDDFNGSALGASWSTTSYGSGARFAVSGGILSLAGGAVYSQSTYPGVPVEARLTIGAATYQHFGLATGLDSVAGNSWAIFSTMGTTGTLYARVNANGATTDVMIGALPTGSHVYQVKPVSGGYQFLIDGALKTTVSRATPSGAPLKIAISSFNATTAGTIGADWVRVDSFPSTGTFTSSVLDAGRTATWGTVAWTASLSPGTSLVVETSSSADGTTWSSWTSASSGGPVSSPAGRFLRYRVLMTTTDSTLTPVFSDIKINWA